MTYLGGHIQEWINLASALLDTEIRQIPIGLSSRNSVRFRFKAKMLVEPMLSDRIVPGNRAEATPADVASIIKPYFTQLNCLKG
jgi:hypothetical protein